MLHQILSSAQTPSFALPRIDPFEGLPDPEVPSSSDDHEITTTQRPSAGPPDAEVLSPSDNQELSSDRRPSAGQPDAEVPPPSHDHELPSARRPSLCNELREVFNLWRPSARETAVGFWGLALVLFGGITTGVVEENPTLWQVCLAVMILSLVGAVASSNVYYQHMRSNTNQRDDRRERSPPSGAAYGDV